MIAVFCLFLVCSLLTVSLQVGFLVALSAELLTSRSVFYSVSVNDMGLYSCATIAAIALAVSLALLSRKHISVELQEAVTSSLTAVQRSASSVTQRPVDKAVDYLFDKAFSLGAIYNLMADDELMF